MTARKSADPLERYNAKRDFAKTAEPKGERAAVAGNMFMVQKHDATRLHWDLRLEADGVLKSWAVTRGPSLDPEQKRLAVRTEDHPLGYATFEGTIPKGEYGGGTVMLWDRGTWEPIAGKSAKDIDDGHLHFILHGERMKGGWLLIRLKPRGKERGENWLLRKLQDGEAGGADDLVERALTSVATGRTMDEIAAGKAVPKRAVSKGKPPAFRAPQLCTLVDHVPTGKGWLHEVKYDGYRCQLAIGGGKAKVFTRSGLDWSDKFPEIAEAGAALDIGSASIDGEIVALDDDGRPSFAKLKDGISAGGRGLILFAFDLLALDGEDLTGETNLTRKDRLRPLIPEHGVLRYADHVLGEGEKLFGAMCSGGYEGVVSKRADAPYLGRRTQSWLKAKCTRRQEFVIIGWSPSEAKGRGFRSLLLGLNESGTLRYAGKVGTGFDHARLTELRDRFDRIAADKPAVAVPRAAARGACWIKPELVAEIAYAEFTAENVVRHASFIGLRDDKPAAAVVPERPADAEPSVKISNSDRVIFPESKITKGELADYYTAVASLMLPWAASRPISLVRCPQGRSKKCFFQKHDAGTFGEHLSHVPVREKDGSTEDYLYVDDADGLLTCVQMGTIEFHGWGSLVADIERADRMVFDLDPDVGLDFEAVKKAARDLKQHLSDIGLVSFPMVSGGKGVHVIVPLTPDAEWPQVKDFSHRFSLALAQAEPDRFTAALAKAKRTGRIFIDYLRNQRGATAVMPYSARARENAPVAVPVSWGELDDLSAPNLWTVRDAAKLAAHAKASSLSGWGLADQKLPDL